MFFWEVFCLIIFGFSFFEDFFDLFLGFFSFFPNCFDAAFGFLFVFFGWFFEIDFYEFNDLFVVRFDVFS